MAGEGEATRVLASVGISSSVTDAKSELEKAKIAVNAGADIINDDSIVEPSGTELRRLLIDKLNVPINSEPIFETSAKSFLKNGDALSFDLKDLLATIRNQAKQGIDIMTLHFAYSRRLAKLVARSNRYIPIVSRGGAILTSYMAKKRVENPYRLAFDEIIDIVSKHNITLSLGTVLRPGSICDGLDQLFLEELCEQRSFIEIANEKGVQVMVEGAGHIRIDQVEDYVKLSKRIISGVPLRSLGPTVCDCAAGYDHITGSIGAALAAMYGCDFVTCTTRAEHIGLPRACDIREAIVAFRIAVHIGDIVKIGDLSKDKAVSKARVKCDWNKIWQEGLFGKDARTLYKQLNPTKFPGCSMCGQYCALRLTQKNLVDILE